MASAHFSIGIDLGTTNCALAFVPLGPSIVAKAAFTSVDLSRRIGVLLGFNPRNVLFSGDPLVNRNRKILVKLFI
jgi:molecular chaperone DnaK (HSP70)